MRDVYLCGKVATRETTIPVIVRQAVLTRLKRKLSYHLSTRKSSTEKGLSVGLLPLCWETVSFPK